MKRFFDIMLGRWIMIGKLPFPIWAIYVVGPAFAYIILYALGYDTTLAMYFNYIGLILAFTGMFYSLLKR